jgi:hypothetical protein
MKTSLTGMSGSGLDFLFSNLEWILPISTVIVILIYYFDKKNKEKK